MLPLGPHEFAQGFCYYADGWQSDSNSRLVTTAIFANLAGLLVETTVIVDTGALWCILSPDDFGPLVGEYGPLEAFVVSLNVRGIRYTGQIYRVPLTLIADEGADLTADATVFVPELYPDETWPHPNFIGLEGFLSRIRFAVDPTQNLFYFGGV